MTGAGMGTESTTARIRELWPVVRALRKDGVSWRQIPGRMHELCGLPRVSHACYLLVAREKRTPGGRFQSR